MTLKYIRLNLQEILIINESGKVLEKEQENVVGAVHIGNKTIFLKRGAYYYDPIRIKLLKEIQRDLSSIVNPDWKVLYSPDSFGLNEWDDETQSHLSLGELSYRHLPKAEKDARKVDTNTLPEVQESH